jgi:hypothetical protein
MLQVSCLGGAAEIILPKRLQQYEFGGRHSDRLATQVD